jgi:hypothetical protein
VGELRKAYDAVFKTIKLTVKFNVAEVVEMALNWVFARTNSAGTIKVHATGAGGPEANQELFLFQKIDGAWKIARYCFSITNPGTRLRTKRTNDGHDESGRDSRSRGAGGSQN